MTNSAPHDESAHARARELAAASLDFALEPAEQRELDEHLSACDACRRYTLELREDATLLAALPERDAPEHVRQAVADGRRRDSTRPFRTLVLALSLVGLMLVPLGAAGLLPGGFGCGFCSPSGAGGPQVITPAPSPRPSGSASLSPSPSPSPSASPGAQETGRS